MKKTIKIDENFLLRRKKRLEKLSDGSTDPCTFLIISSQLSLINTILKKNNVR